MGVCFSLCVRREDQDDYYYDGYDERANLLDGEDFEQEERLAIKRKEEIDKIVSATVSDFVDIASFMNIKQSIPQVDIKSLEFQKKNFCFGNGFTNNYHLPAEELNKLYSVSSKPVPPELKKSIEVYSKKLKARLEESLDKLAPLSEKLVGKL